MRRRERPGNDFDDRARLGDWGPLDDLQIAAIHAHLLPTGQVLYWDRSAIAKGTEWGQRTSNPRTHAITTIEPTLEYEPFCSGHWLLPDGWLSVAGGHIDTAVGEDRASVFNPITKQWTTVPQHECRALVPDDRIARRGRRAGAVGLDARRQRGICLADLPQIYMASRGDRREPERNGGPATIDLEWR